MHNVKHVLSLLALAFALAACGQSESTNRLDIQKSDVMSSFATVESVDMTTRMVTLRDPDGKQFTIHAGEEVVNLPQVRPGDIVDVTYAETLSVRMAEPGEKANKITGVIGRAEPGEKPAYVDVTETTVTATITGIDKEHDTATLRMADDSYRVVKVEDPTNLDKVKVGDVIIITFQEAVGIFVKGRDQ